MADKNVDVNINLTANTAGAERKLSRIPGIFTRMAKGLDLVKAATAKVMGWFALLGLAVEGVKKLIELWKHFTTAAQRAADAVKSVVDTRFSEDMARKVSAITEEYNLLAKSIGEAAAEQARLNQLADVSRSISQNLEDATIRERQTRELMNASPADREAIAARHARENIDRRRARGEAAADRDIMGLHARSAAATEAAGKIETAALPQTQATIAALRRQIASNSAELASEGILEARKETLEKLVEQDKKSLETAEALEKQQLETIAKLKAEAAAAVDLAAAKRDAAEVSRQIAAAEKAGLDYQDQLKREKQLEELEKKAAEQREKIAAAEEALAAEQSKGGSTYRLSSSNGITSMGGFATEASKTISSTAVTIPSKQLQKLTDILASLKAIAPNVESIAARSQSTAATFS